VAMGMATSVDSSSGVPTAEYPAPARAGGTGPGWPAEARPAAVRAGAQREHTAGAQRWAAAGQHRYAERGTAGDAPRSGPILAGMRLLVIGGTRFLGRGVVAAGLAAGAEVTTFTRGVSGSPPDGVEAFHGDRETADGLALLGGRDWDIVVDTSGYLPRVVGDSARLLADRVGHYVFVSTLNVYPGWPTEPIRAGTPVHDCPPDAGPPGGSNAEVDPSTYGTYKAGCERAVDVHFAGRSTHVRAGLIVGPHDDVGRLPWWISRIARGGEVLAPVGPDRPVRLIDARDLGAWCVHCGQAGVVGAYVATGPAGRTTYGELFGACREVTGSDATFTWVPDDFLVEQGVTPCTEVPLWSPAARAPALWDQDTSAAEAAGLRCRPVSDTVADVAAWLGEDPGTQPGGRYRETPGLAPDREAELLAAWRARAA
jgi:2'-hydroxyisoflavone reductase